MFLFQCFATNKPPKWYLDQLKKEKWEFLFEQDNIFIYVREKKGSDYSAFKGVSVLKASIPNLLHILRNVEMSADWTPNLVYKKTIEDLSLFEAVTYNHNSLPWPVKDREMVMHSLLKMDYRNKRIEVISKSIDHKDAPSNKELIKAHITYSHLYLVPLREGDTIVDVDAHVDPKGWIPSWLVNMIQRNWPYEFLTRLEKKSQADGLKPEKGFVEINKKLLQLRGLVSDSKR